MTLTWRLAAEVLGIYAISRLLGLIYLLVVERQLRGGRFPAGPVFHLWENVFDRWDVGFYRMAATDGYPAVLPLRPDGTVDGNTWAFFPAFPFVSAAVTQATGFGFIAAALIVNLCAGAVAAVLIGAIVRDVADDDAVIRTVAFWTFFPTAFVLQVPYAEAVFMAFAAGFLLALITGRHGLAAVLILCASLSRGYAIPLSVAALYRVATVLWSMRQAGRPTAPPRLFGLAALAAAAVAAPFLWLGIAWYVTGRADAYAVTQRAWGFSFDPAVALTRWSSAIGNLGHDLYFTAVVVTLVAAGLAAIAVLRLPFRPELRVYTVLSVAFLLAISQPESTAFGSIPRFVFGILTLPMILGLVVRRNAVAAGIAVAFAAVQYVWVFYIWSGKYGVAP